MLFKIEQSVGVGAGTGAASAGLNPEEVVEKLRDEGAIERLASALAWG